jgi:hypothetical protein
LRSIHEIKDRGPTTTTFENCGRASENFSWASFEFSRSGIAGQPQQPVADRFPPAEISRSVITGQPLAVMILCAPEMDCHVGLAASSQ